MHAASSSRMLFTRNSIHSIDDFEHIQYAYSNTAPLVLTTMLSIGQKCRHGHVIQSLMVTGSAPIIDYSVVTDIQAAEGRYAVLRCVATGSPRPSIHYLKDGVTVGRSI